MWYDRTKRAFAFELKNNLARFFLWRCVLDRSRLFFPFVRIIRVSMAFVNKSRHAHGNKCTLTNNKQQQSNRKKKKTRGLLVNALFMTRLRVISVWSAVSGPRTTRLIFASVLSTLRTHEFYFTTPLLHLSSHPSIHPSIYPSSLSFCLLPAAHPHYIFHNCHLFVSPFLLLLISPPPSTR